MFAPLVGIALRAPRYTTLPYALTTALCAAFLLMAFFFGVQSLTDWFALTPFGAFGALLAGVRVAARDLGAERGWSTILGMSSVGVLCEWLAARVDFPYTIALTLWRNPLLLWVAGWISVWGLAFDLSLRRRDSLVVARRIDPRVPIAVWNPSSGALL